MVGGSDLPSADEGARHLTPRELEIVRLACRGLSLIETGHQLKLTLGTVKFYRSSVYRKLGIHSVAELRQYAERMGLF